MISLGGKVLFVSIRSIISSIAGEGKAMEFIFSLAYSNMLSSRVLMG